MKSVFGPLSVLFVFALLYGTPAAALTLESLTLDCRLKAASLLSEDGGKIHLDTINADDEMEITFSGFDDKNGRALVVGNQGSAPAFFYNAPDHLQIIELTDSKNVSTTTIAFSQNSVRAVMTRHMWMLDGGTFSVYAGPCSLRTRP